MQQVPNSAGHHLWHPHDPSQQSVVSALEPGKRAIEEPVRSCGTDFPSLLKLRAHVRNVILARCGEPGIAELVKPET